MDKIDELLTRGVENIYPSKDALESVLRSGKKLTLYQGFDPTGIQFHIGHAVGLRKLRQWQELGHHVIFLIGDGTGQAGDPSGKTRARDKFLNLKELKENAKSYVMQASRIVRFDGPNPAEIRYNSDWLNKLTLVDILDIAGRVSFQQMVERDLYQARIKAGESLSLREFFYPLLQGYDSVAMNVDLELGGSDQVFNMLMGRQLLKSFKNKEKFVMTVPLLTDSRGVKIGKTEGNVIGITDPPNDFFGKIMSLGDDAIIPCFTLLTNTPIDTIKDMEERMKKGENPMVFKKQLAFELTIQFNDDASAQTAQKEFETRFQKKELTISDLPTKLLTAFPIGSTLLGILVLSGIAESNSAARRLVEQHAVKINDTLIASTKDIIQLKKDDILQAGKKAVKII